MAAAIALRNNDVFYLHSTTPKTERITDDAACIVLAFFEVNAPQVK
jgi:hypothetical protein